MAQLAAELAERSAPARAAELSPDSRWRGLPRLACWRTIPMSEGGGPLSGL